MEEFLRIKIKTEKEEIRDQFIGTTLKRSVKEKLDMFCQQNDIKKSVLLNQMIEQLVKDVE